MLFSVLCPFRVHSSCTNCNACAFVFPSQEKLARIKARKEAAAEKKRQERLKFIQWRTEKRSVVKIQKQWRALKANSRRWRKFKWRRGVIRKTLPIMKRLRVKACLLRWIRKKKRALATLVRSTKREWNTVCVHYPDCSLIPLNSHTRCSFPMPPTVVE